MPMNSFCRERTQERKDSIQSLRSLRSFAAKKTAFQFVWFVSFVVKNLWMRPTAALCTSWLTFFGCGHWPRWVDSCSFVVENLWCEAGRVL
jgi:hypothetical protein